MLTPRAGLLPAAGDRGVSGPPGVRKTQLAISPAIRATLFFQLINERYERASTVPGSNQGFEERGPVLGDEVVAAALLDRLLHHGHIVASGGTATGSAGARTRRGHCIRPRREEPRPTIRRGRGGHLARRRARLPRNSGRSAPDARSPRGKRARGSLHGPSGGPLGKASSESQECQIFESHFFPLFEAH